MSEDAKSVTVCEHRIMATTIVNNAVIKCMLGGLPITHDNIILLIGDFADPQDPRNARLIADINQQIDDIIDTTRRLKALGSIH